MKKEIICKDFKKRTTNLGYSIEELSKLFDKKMKTIYIYRSTDKAPYYVWFIINLLETLKEKDKKISELESVIQAQSELLAKKK